MIQPDLFEHTEVPAGATCGGCVVRNGHRDTPVGWCPWHDMRRNDDPACADWFGTEQLYAALYGRRLTIKGA